MLLNSHSSQNAGGLIERCRTQWQFGDWEGLAAIDAESIHDHPERALLALYVATAHAQRGKFDQSREHIALAREWGCDPRTIARILLAGVHNCLGQAAAIAGQFPRARSHFEQAVLPCTPLDALPLLAQARFDSQTAQTGSPIDILGLNQGTNRLSATDKVGRHIRPGKGKHIILVAGMPRSGSTWLFNCVRLLLRIKHPDVYGAWEKDYDPTHPSPVHIIKIHDPNDAMLAIADEIFTSRRDIREIGGSMVRMGWLEKDKLLDDLDWTVNLAHPYWQTRCTLEIEYAHILAYPGLLVENIGHALGIHPDVRQAKAIGEELAAMTPGESYDKVTQLHPNHRASGEADYKHMIGEALWIELSLRYHDWLSKYGYAV